MSISIFKSKIHRITVTETRIDYEGSVTLDTDLMQAAHILPYEQVHIWDVTNGNRLTTYALEGISGSGDCCINGAAAHLINKGDIVIIGTFKQINEEDYEIGYKPTVVLVETTETKRNGVKKNDN